MSSEWMRCARVAAVTMGLAACAGFERGERYDVIDEVPGEGGDALSFGADVHPVLMTYCGDCHGQGGDASTSELLFSGSADEDYAQVLRFVDLEAVSFSPLLVKAAGAGHPGGTSLEEESDEYELIETWIAAGVLP